MKPSTRCAIVARYAKWAANNTRPERHRAAALICNYLEQLK